MKKYTRLLFILLIISENSFAQNNKKEQLKMPEGFQVIQNIFYAGNKNKAQTLDVFIPENRKEGKLPALVFIHGGGWKGGSKKQAYKKLSPFIKEGNYVGFSIDYRLSNEAKWPVQIYDCKAAIR